MLNLIIHVLWLIATIMIFLSGIYFCFKLGFIHLNFKEMIKVIQQKKNNKDDISLFQSLTRSLAGRIGVGSLSGIALAIYLGGPGVIFWIWLTSLLCSTNAFAESVLAIVFRHKDNGNIYRGGPFYYIKEGLGNKKLACFYAIIVLIAYIGGFMTIQVNTITKSITNILPILPLTIGGIIAVIAGITILGGVKKIANTTSKLVPIMTASYIVVCSYIIIKNYTMIPSILQNIFYSAFNFKAFGMGTLSTLLIGMQKGIFSSEVGLGTGSIAAVTADSDYPAKNGIVQVFEIHFENILIATITAFVVCMFNYQSLLVIDPNGIEITLQAFEYHLGHWGGVFITIIITLFGLATTLTGYYYGESSLKFLKKVKKIDVIFLKIITVIIILIGSVASSKILWNITDVFVGILAVINIYAIIQLRSTVIEEYKVYRENNNHIKL